MCLVGELGVKRQHDSVLVLYGRCIRYACLWLRQLGRVCQFGVFQGRRAGGGGAVVKLVIRGAAHF